MRMIGSIVTVPLRWISQGKKLSGGLLAYRLNAPPEISETASINCPANRRSKMIESKRETITTVNSRIIG